MSRWLTLWLLNQWYYHQWLRNSSQTSLVSGQLLQSPESVWRQWAWRQQVEQEVLIWWSISMCRPWLSDGFCNYRMAGHSTSHSVFLCLFNFFQRELSNPTYKSCSHNHFSVIDFCTTLEDQLLWRNSDLCTQEMWRLCVETLLCYENWVMSKFI